MDWAVDDDHLDDHELDDDDLDDLDDDLDGGSSAMHTNRESIELDRRN